jgi:hypothetical protein
MKTRYYLNPVDDDIQRALRVINHNFETMGFSVHMSSDQGRYNVWIDNNDTGDIVTEFPELSKNEATMLLAGMYKGIHIMTGEGY